MRRHTTLVEPSLSTTIESPTTTEFPANSDEPPPSRNGFKGVGGESISRISSVPDGVRASASALAAIADTGEEPREPREPRDDAPNGTGTTGINRKGDPFDRPDSPPVQEETTKHHRFSMLRFRTASDSQLSARSRLQQEKPPPMPQRTCPPLLGRLFLAPLGPSWIILHYLALLTSTLNQPLPLS